MANDGPNSVFNPPITTGERAARAALFDVTKETNLLRVQLDNALHYSKFLTKD